MTWQFELVAGPYEGPTGGVVWHDGAILFSVIDEGRLLRFDPETAAISEFRRYANRVNGLAHGPGGELYGAQEGGRRLVAVDALLDGKYHNQPCDLAVDRAHRIWFADPRHPVIPFGPAIFPFLDHASVLRLERNDRRAWVAKRVTYDTASPRAVLLSPDERTLYVADGELRRAAHVRRGPPRTAARHRGHVPRCGRQHRRLRRLGPQRARAADLPVLAARRGDREPSVPRRLPQSLLFRRRRSCYALRDHRRRASLPRQDRRTSGQDKVRRAS
jgi:hypothetical protein